MAPVVHPERGESDPPHLWVTMSDKTQVNLTGAKQIKSVWLVKVCLQREHKTLLFWLIVTEELNVVEGMGCI